VRVGGYVADIVGENGIIEIQTASFSRMREKLTQFLEYACVTIVWPCVVNKRLIRIDKESGEVISMRRSNVHRGEYDLFWELYSIRTMVSDPRLSIRIAQLEVDEYRPNEPKKGRRRKGAYNGTERYPTALNGEIILSAPADYLRFLPAGLPEEFTAKDFAVGACINADTARCTLGVLTELGAVERIGKKAKAYLYRIAPEYTAAKPSLASDCPPESIQPSKTAPFDPEHISAVISQPLEGLDGHMCAAILSGLPLAEIIRKSRAGRWGMTAKKLMETLDIFGVPHSGRLIMTRKPGTVLPQCCIISEHGHFLLHCRGLFIDSVRGQFEVYDQSQMTGYIEIHL